MKIINNKVVCLDWITDKEEWDKLVSEDKPEGKYTIMVSVTLFDRLNRLNNVIDVSLHLVDEIVCEDKIENKINIQMNMAIKNLAKLADKIMVEIKHRENGRTKAIKKINKYWGKYHWDYRNESTIRGIINKYR